MKILICFFIMVATTNGNISNVTSKKKRSFGFGAFNGVYNHGDNYYDGAFGANDGHYLMNHHANPPLHTHSHTLVTKKFGFPIPQPYPIPYPVKVPVDRPVPVPVPVHHHHPVPYVKHVKVPVPVYIPRPYAVPVYPKPHFHHHDHFSGWSGGNSYW